MEGQGSKTLVFLIVLSIPKVKYLLFSLSIACDAIIGEVKLHVSC